MIRSRLLMIFVGLALHAGTQAGVAARVDSISEEYGNVNTDVTWERVLELGVEPGSTFTIQFGERTFQVMFGTTYSDVERGEWVGFITDTGMLRLARNFENAAQTLGCEVGDIITISAD